MENLKPCPCGETPDRLYITEGPTCKYAYVYGSCCGEWNVEFKTKYFKIDTKDCMQLAIKEWNDTTRHRKE